MNIAIIGGVILLLYFIYIRHLKSMHAENLKIDLYLELLKRCLTNSIYDDDLDVMNGSFEPDALTGKLRSNVPVAAEASKKYLGEIWPTRAHTMIGIPRLDNLRYCVETVIREKVPGDLIETGVWRGGASIFMRGVLKVYNVKDRTVWVADSFEGLPPVDESVHFGDSTLNLDRFADLAVSLEVVRENFERYDLLDDQVIFLKGWFRDTLPKASIGKLAVMRLDGDLYESTMDALTNLYPKLSLGGFVIIDDYNTVAGCNDAVHAYRQSMNINEPLILIEGYGAFWRKNK